MSLIVHIDYVMLSIIIDVYKDRVVGVSDVKEVYLYILINEFHPWYLRRSK